MNRVKRIAPFCLLIISLMSSMVRVSSQTREGVRRRPTPGQQRPATSNEQRTPRQPTIATPTAAWLLAAPNPLNVTAIPSQYSAVSKLIMSASGGSLIATGPDGTRFTLTVPPKAVPNDVKITMLPVIAIENLPFNGGLAAAVQLTPDDVQFYKPATLLIEPPQNIPPREQMSFASFAYQGEGREFHLYPMETDPSRIAFKLVTLGGYGVARGTKAEQETVRARIPTDPAARLSMQMQKGLSLIRERRLRAASSRVSSRGDLYGGSPRIIPASFNRNEVPQQSPAEGEALSAWLKDLEAKLREFYDQVVMPSLRNARPGCTDKEQEQLGQILDVALGWVRQVELLGLTSRTDDRQERLLKEGWTAAELQAMDVSADEYRQKVQAIMDAFFRLLKESFDKIHQCCIEAPKVEYAEKLRAIERQGALWFNGDPASLLGPNYREKIEKCACLLSDGGWQGTVKHTESYDDKGSKPQGKGEESWHRRLNYQATITLQPAQISATGDVLNFHAYKGDIGRGGECVLEKISNHAYGDSLNAGIRVYVNVAPDGTYFASYTLPCIETSGENKVQSILRGPGCQPFTLRQHNWTKAGPEDGNVCPTQEGVTLSDGRRVAISGRIDPKNPAVLSGTATFAAPLPENPAARRTITINWNLTRCK